MNFAKVAKAHWFDVVTPFAFRMPICDPVMVLTRTLVMVMVMVAVMEMTASTGMFLALSDLTDKPLSQTELTAGLRTNGLGTVIGGLFNSVPVHQLLAKHGPGGRHRRAQRRAARGWTRASGSPP